jgi:hypothetical protein
MDFFMPLKITADRDGGQAREKNLVDRQSDSTSLG